jgi:hypothetical protein
MRRSNFVLTVLLLASCTTGGADSSGVVIPHDVGVDGSTNATDTFPSCQLCVVDTDCPTGGRCAQFGGDIYCAPPCGTARACPSDRLCQTTTSATGEQLDVCVPRNDVCASPPGTDAGPTADDTSVTPPPSDAGTPPPPTTTCGSLVGPSTAAGCQCDPTLHACQANGCYGGWWCDTTTSRCHAAPTTCGGAADSGVPPVDSGTPPPPVDAGPPGTVGANGGNVSQLRFAVVGDTRPPAINDTSGYPSAIIGRIYQDLAAASPAIPFAVSTGDYVFSSPTGTTASPQFDMYVAARAKYPGVLFAAMGNHECTGATTSNCIAGSSDLPSNNFDLFKSKLLAPIAKTLPYYSVRIDATDASWSAKFVFVAGNAWDSAQSTWLSSALAQPTTYTFVVRHEPAAATTAPGVPPSEKIMAAHPLTLAIVGHTHTYGKTGARQVTIGNGGAPLVGAGNYGYGLVNRRASDGAIVVDMIDYQSGAADPSFHFALKADGSAAPP